MVRKYCHRLIIVRKQLFQNIYIEIVKQKSICMGNGQQIKNYFLTGKSKSKL